MPRGSLEWGNRGRRELGLPTLSGDLFGSDAGNGGDANIILYSNDGLVHVEEAVPAGALPSAPGVAGV